MTFSSPLLLVLLLFLPLVVWLGWPSRGPSRRREIASLLLRSLILLALVLSLAGLEVARAADDLAVVFLIDVSDSMPDEAKAFAVRWVRDAIAEMGPDDQAAVILFGGEALVERPMRASRELAAFSSIPTTIETDLAEAIRLALALFPANSASRLVILSDGAATTGNAAEAARLAAASGVQIVAVPFSFQRLREVLVTGVRAPTRVRVADEFDLEVTVESTLATSVGLRVLAGDEIVYTGTVDLNPGPNSFLVPLTAGEAGFRTYRVQVIPPATDDGFYENNELATFSDVVGPPRVLLVAAPGKDIEDPAEYLAESLQASDIELVRARPSGLPADLTVLAEYASVILVDVPARELSSRQQQAIKQYVRDLGGGLVAVGGTQSYGVGGWFKTALEDALPVEMQLRDQERRPRLTIVFVIDKSGSMADSSGGAPKVELAKEAASRSVELLAPGDRVGVIAFDQSASWVVPITEIDSPDPIINQIGTIRAGGGTDILAGVQLMAEALPNDDAQLRHVILLTDGGASPSGIPELVQSLYQTHGITLSAVGVGRDVAPFLPELAQVGGGRYHYTDDPASIPQIFTEETTLATRAYIIEEEFFPIQVRSSSILAGIEAVPPLRGYVGTTAKDVASTILVSDLQDGAQDPILASWQYGLGRSVAWTSDATARWAQQWVNWENFPRLWAQMVRFTIGETLDTAISAEVTRRGEAALLAVDAVDLAGNYLNGLALQANIVAPDGSSQRVDMVQTAPGRYQAEFAPTAEGAYLIRIAAEEDSDTPAGAEGSSFGQTTGWVLSYSPEYRVLQADPNALLRLADLTGGGLAGNEPGSVFEHDLVAQRARRPIWPWLLLVAVLLLPFDIGVRRLVITRYDAQRAWARGRDFVRTLRKPQATPAQVERLERLQRAKQRAGTSAAAVDLPVFDRADISQMPEAPAERTTTSAAAAPSERAGGRKGAASTAATLLAKRRARREEQQDEQT